MPVKILAFSSKFILRKMHVQNLKLFQNFLFNIKYHYGNDVVIPVNLFSDDFKTKIVG